MEQNAGPAGAEDDLHFASGCGHCAELEDGSASGFLGQMLRAFAAGELIEAGAASGSRRAASGVGFVFGDDEDAEPAERLGVAGECAVGCGYEDAAELFRVAGAD